VNSLEGKYLVANKINNFTLCICSVCEARGLLFTDNILDLKYPGIGANLLSMALGGIAFFIVTLLLEQRFFIHKLLRLFTKQSTTKAVICAHDVSQLLAYFNVSSYTIG